MKKIVNFFTDKDNQEPRLIFGYIFALTIYNIYTAGKFGWAKVFVYSLGFWFLYGIARTLSNVFVLMKHGRFYE